ncbi:hypothetical protein SISNIDRAFT_550340 [Sistotremastrum niveocremeum HHB9708]|uniref:Uncharacterized protein n=1 Tax=Sistotremastrum niveocremeum HHB9708 TaxID=1314777 RepID=A0A164U123_9AGAM|nr:hypothetical protein SISNIDRAFT_550340 [Sistotremastrum niveocremeum HHB9708]
MVDTVSLWSLVTITGCYNTRSWEVATFEGSQSRIAVGLQVEGAAGASVSNERTHHLGTDRKSGPELLHGTRPVRQVVPWGEESALSDRDQSVFIKGWRFKERSRRWPLRLRAQAGPHTLPEDSDDDDDECCQSVFVESFPPAEEYRTVYDQLIDHFMTETNAGIVMIHDDEIAIVCKILDRPGLHDDEDYQYFDHFMHPT